jgi:protein-S-isoprenylcysteine O-methyltransferase Ste14
MQVTAEGRTSPAASGEVLRVTLALVALTVLVAVVLFGAAGTWAWPAGWAYLLLLTGVTVLSRVVVYRTSPDTLRERAKVATVSGVQRGDRVLVTLLIVVGPVLLLSVAGLDHRFGWTAPLGRLLPVVGGVLVVVGGLVATWAMAVNPFFSAVARIQRDRGQVVVATGPYRRVRHPAYAASALATLAGPVLLGSLAALVPALLTVVVIVVRTAREDALLRAELEGYAAYAGATRWRLLPGVW